MIIPFFDGAETLELKDGARNEQFALLSCSLNDPKTLALDLSDQAAVTTDFLSFHVVLPVVLAEKCVCS